MYVHPCWMRLLLLLLLLDVGGVYNTHTHGGVFVTAACFWFTFDTKPFLRCVFCKDFFDGTCGVFLVDILTRSPFRCVYCKLTLAVVLRCVAVLVLLVLVLQMDGVDNNSSADDSSSSDEEENIDITGKNRKRKPALRDADRDELEGIGGDDGEEEGIVAGGKVW